MDWENALKAPGNQLDSHSIQKIMQQKLKEPNKFQSYWEKDELDIENWSENEIQRDPGKQLLLNAENDNLDSLEKLLDAHPKLISYKDNDGYTALHRAAYSNNINIVKSLVERGADLEARTEMGWTPLHSAAYWNNVEAVNCLLNNGSNINAITNSGQTALHLAASQRDCKESIMLLLMNPFIDFSIRNEMDETAKDIASRSCEYYRLFEITDRNLNEFNI
jgi:ankyrin repeat domain-containing protein 49